MRDAQTGAFELIGRRLLQQLFDQADLRIRELNILALSVASEIPSLRWTVLMWFRVKTVSGNTRRRRHRLHMLRAVKDLLRNICNSSSRRLVAACKNTK